MRGLIFLCALLVAGHAAAAELTVSVKGQGGRPVPDAVVTLYPAGGAPPMSQAHFDWPMRVAQQHLQFTPFVLIAPVGATVAFPNYDTVRHHVYSFSPVHPFELKLYGHDETRTVRFERPGVVPLGCNIHDSMIAFIKVVDTPYAAKTGADGQVTLHDAPAGSVVMHVWHPYMKSPDNEVVRTIVIPRSGVSLEAVAIDLRSPPERSHAY